MSKTMELVNKTRQSVNRRMVMKCGEVVEIMQNSEGMLEAISNGFYMGYAKGLRAAKAEARAKAKKDKKIAV